LGECVQVGAALGAGADDQERTLRVGREPLRGQQRNCRRPARRDGGPIEHQAPRARSHVEHHDIALDGRPSGARVAGREGDELGDGDFRVARRHDEQAATAGQGLHQAGWYLHHRIAHHPHQLPHERGVGQAGRRGSGIRQIIHWEEVGNCPVRILSYRNLRRPCWRPGRRRNSIKSL
jgi:hypothetical protein